MFRDGCVITFVHVFVWGLTALWGQCWTPQCTSIHHSWCRAPGSESDLRNVHTSNGNNSLCVCVYVFCIRLALKHLSSQQINPVIRPQSACATLHIRVTITLRSPNKSSLPPCRSPQGKHLPAQLRLGLRDQRRLKQQ